MSLRRIFISLAIFSGISLLAGYGAYSHIKTSQGSLEADTLIYIPSGEGVGAIAGRLKDAGVIEKIWHFKVVNRVLDTGGSLKAGEYEIPAGVSIEALIRILTEGETYQRQFVIPEGYSNKQIYEVLMAAEGLDHDKLVMPAEGTLFPDTYSYEYGTLAQDLVSKMMEKTYAVVDKYWEDAGVDFPLQTREEILTLASIIEKETAVAEEREVIAAVFLRRLEKRMRLQTDPTVIYGITGGTPLGRPLSKADLAGDTPYNTYVHYGLPPGPIANPGEASIRAVFEPADVDYLYFVADGTGGHAFAKTLAEHNNNVKKWRKIEAARNGAK